MHEIKKFRIVDKNTGETVLVTFEEVIPSRNRASIMEALEEDLHETWDIPVSPHNEGVVVEEV